MCASGDRGACSTAPEEVEVAVVGAGFAGIITTVKLRKAGITSMACFEKEPEVSKRLGPPEVIGPIASHPAKLSTQRTDSIVTSNLWHQ